jgi:hypothetical protein
LGEPWFPLLDVPASILGKRRMIPKPLAFTSVCAAIALCGCASAPAGPDNGLVAFDCRSNSCDVRTGYHFPGAISVPEVIQVDAKTRQAVVDVKWTLSTILGVRFAEAGGIAFQDPRFKCEADAASTLSYKCAGTNLEPGGTYKYTITLSGFLKPFPLDPIIRNGN